MRVFRPLKIIRRCYMHPVLYWKKEQSGYACILKSNETFSEESIEKEIKRIINDIEDKHYEFLKHDVSRDDFLKYGNAAMLEFMKCKFESEKSENVESCDDIMQCDEESMSKALSLSGK